MKGLLIVGGVLFILVALALLAGAVVLFVMARKRRAGVTPIAAASHAPAPPPIADSADPNATVVVNVRNQTLGALYGVSPNVAGRVIPIDQYGVYIGRDQTLSQVIVESPDVSKRHVWVGIKDGAPVAIDQGSTNGTFLNTAGSAIGETRLRIGDTIILANDAARFTYRP